MFYSKYIIYPQCKGLCTQKEKVKLMVFEDPMPVQTDNEPRPEDGPQDVSQDPGGGDVYGDEGE